jgi:hypothetical protein
MSHVYGVEIKGLMHYDACPFGSEERSKEVMRWLSLMNLPHFGLKITYPTERYHLPNSHGGKTIFQAFKITGAEAINMSGVYDLVKAFWSIGVITTCHYNDMESHAGLCRMAITERMNSEQLQLVDMMILAKGKVESCP